jgi:hypothetical protein
VLDAPGGRDVDAALAALLEATKDVVLDLHVPGVVELPGLQHGPGGRHGVAAPLHLDLVEERPVRQVVLGMELRVDHVPRLEVDEPVGSGADRLEVGRGFSRLRPLEPVEEVPGDELAGVAAERLGPERRRLLEDQLHRVAVELVRPGDVAVRARPHGGGRRVGGVFPVEDDVVRGERLPVVPRDVLLESPGHREPVLRYRAVLLAGQLGREDRVEVTVGVERGEGLVEEAAGVLVLGAVGEVGVEQRRRLPPQEPELPAPAPARRGEGRPGLGPRHPGRPQHLGGQRRGEAEPYHHPRELPPADRAGPDALDPSPELTLVHGKRLLTGGRRMVG